MRTITVGQVYRLHLHSDGQRDRLEQMEGITDVAEIEGQVPPGSWDELVGVEVEVVELLDEDEVLVRLPHGFDIACSPEELR